MRLCTRSASRSPPSRLDGYQFAFFLLQAPAVVIGRTIQQKTKANLAARIATVLWMWLTSMLFFHGVARVFPFFYAAEPWLRSGSNDFVTSFDSYLEPVDFG